MKLKAQFQSVISSSWIDLEPIRLGVVPETLATADVFVLVEENERPKMRIDVYCDFGAELHTFSDLITWQNFIVIGIGHRLYLVNRETHKTQTHLLGNYFGHLYTHNDFLYVASAERLFCLNVNGSLNWVSEELGIDGVVITDIGDEFIDGEGEWDPPGGWKPFRLKVDSGMRV